MRIQHFGFLVAGIAVAGLLAACGKPVLPDNTVGVGQTDFVTVEPDSSGGRNVFETTATGTENAGAPADSRSGAPSGRTGEVEEGDIYRVDKNRLFYLNTYRGFIIYDLNDPKNPKQLGRLPVNGYPIEMFVEGNTVYALLRDSLYLTQAPDGLKVTRRRVSQLVSIDVSNLAAPKILKSIDIIGQLSEGVSRKIENTIYVVSNMPKSYYWPGYPYGDNTTEQAWVYSFNVADSQNVQLVDKLQIFEGGSGHTSNTTNSAGRWFSGIAISATANTLHVVENWYTWSHVFGGPSDCGASQSSQEAVVSIIDISNPMGRIRRHTKFSTYGALTDQFKHTYLYDEATKKGYYFGIFAQRSWSSANCQGMSFIRNTLEAWDISDGAAPVRVSALPFGHENETVRGSTFDLSRKVAYAITARTIDPLYALDLSDPTHLKVSSSIEGLSGDMSVFRLIHNNEFLLGVGRDNATGCETNGAGGATWATNVAVSLIDVRNLSAIRLVQRQCVNVQNAEWVSSQITWNLDQAHKMIGMYSDALTNVVTVPVSYYSKQNSEDGWYWYRPQAAVGMLSYDLGAYDPLKAAADQTVMKNRGTVLHPAGQITRSILFAHEAGAVTRRMMVNLSDTHVSVVDIDDLQTPAVQSVIEVAPYHARVYRFGEYLVDEVQVGGGNWWQPGASEFRVKRAAAGADEAATIASFTVGRVDRVVQWKNLLLLVRPMGDPTQAGWRSTSTQSEVVAYDLSDPAHPTRKGSLQADFLSHQYYGFWCGTDVLGYWPYWGSYSYGATKLVTTDQGVAVLTRKYVDNGWADGLFFINTTNANQLTLTSKEVYSHTYNTRPFAYAPPSRNVMGLVSGGENGHGFFLTARDRLGELTHSGSTFAKYRYVAEHQNASLQTDWSVNTPGEVVQVFESGDTTRLLSVDSRYRQLAANKDANWYPDQRMHLLRRTGNSATLTDTLLLEEQQLGDLVGDANRLFVNVRPAYWHAYAWGTRAGEGGASTVYQDTLKAIDISTGAFNVRSSSELGTYGAQLMGLRGDRLFVNLVRDGVMVVDVARLDAPSALHFARTLGWATHVAFGETMGFVAAGSFGIFEIPLEAEATISRL